jgi:hypothetical protein
MNGVVDIILEELDENPRPKKEDVTFPLAVGPAPDTGPGFVPVGSQPLICKPYWVRSQQERDVDTASVGQLSEELVKGVPQLGRVEAEGRLLAGRVVEKHPTHFFPVKEVVVAAHLLVTKLELGLQEARTVKEYIERKDECDWDLVSFCEVNVCVPVWMEVVHGMGTVGSERQLEQETEGRVEIVLDNPPEESEGLKEEQQPSPPSPRFSAPSYCWTYGRQPSQVPQLQVATAPVELQPVNLNEGQPSRPGRTPRRQKLCLK